MFLNVISFPKATAAKEYQKFMDDSTEDKAVKEAEISFKVLLIAENECSYC